MLFRNGKPCKHAEHPKTTLGSCFIYLYTLFAAISISEAENELWQAYLSICLQNLSIKKYASGSA